jgi:DNA-directed RNA polymerase specialized sigma24 family protein
MSNNSPKIYSFEEKSDVISKAVNRKRNKWHLSAIAWMDFDDVSQIIKLHIYKKWHMWDQSKPLEPWIGRIISNQLKNLIRNNYTNYSRPCLSCPHNAGEDQCLFTPNGLQNSYCSLYAKWEKNKKMAYDLKMAVTLENHKQELEQKVDNGFFSFLSVEVLNSEMQKCLTGKQYDAYIMLFFEKKDEEDVAKFMGYKTNEKNRMIGYKQIKNLKKLFKDKALEILKNKDICYGGD